MSMTPASGPHAGQPFGVMLRGAVVPAVVAGLAAVVVLGVARGQGSVIGSLLGLVVSVGFFATGMLMLSRLVRSASPGAFFAVAMAVYLGQIIGLMLFIMAFLGRDFVDGLALGVTAFVVTIAWQIFAMRAFRRARFLVYDEPEERPGDHDADQSTGTRARMVDGR